MTRAAVPALAHFSALPLGLLFAVPLGFVSTFLGTPAVEIELDDAMFIVAHVYPALVLATCLAVASFVARRWGRFNGALLAGWGLLLCHLLAGAFLTRAVQGLPDPEPNTFTLLIPADSSMGYAYLGTAGAALLALLTGLGISFARRLPGH